jgi:heme exporter protein B
MSVQAAESPPASPGAGEPGRPRQTNTPPRLPAVVMALLRKELLVELRTLESVPGMALFSLSTFVIFHFALNRASVEGDLAAGILLVTLLFAGMLGINRLFVADEEQGGFDALLLAPVDRSAMLIAKVCALGIYLVVLEIVAVPAFGLLLLGSSLAAALPDLIVVLALVDLGLAVIGTFVAALAVRTRARDLIGPLIALPLLVPIAIGASHACAPLLSSGPHAGSGVRWLLLIGLYDLVFGLIAYAVFDFLLED